MAIAVEIRDPKESTEIDIFLNDEEIHILIRDLEGLIGKDDHIHYMSPDWGGDDLATKARGPGALAVHHLCIARIDYD